MPDAALAGRTDNRSTAIFVGGIVAIGCALRLFHLGTQSFWLDEALSVAYARLSWPQFVHLTVARELNMLPYYLLLRGWIRLGSEEGIVRSLSAVCSIATLPLMYRLGKRLLGARAGLIAVTLLALNPYHIRFAQEARGYSLMLLLITGSTLLLVRAVASASRHSVALWVAYVVTSALAAYAHFYAGLAVLAQWTSVAIIRPGGLPTRAFALAAVAIGVLLLPIAAFVLLGHADPATWIPIPTVRRVEYLVYSLLGGDNTTGARVFAYPALLAALLAAGFGARAAWRADRRDNAAWHFALIVAGTTVPIVLVLAASLIKPIFVDKYLGECLPFAVLLLAAGLDRLRPRALSVGAGVLILASSIHADVFYYRQPDKDDWRAATEYVVASAQPGDDVLFFPRFVSAPFDYYRASLRATTQVAVVIYPGTLGEADIEDALSGLGHDHGRLWALFNQDGRAGAAVRDSLAHRFPILSDRQFTGVRVLLYDLR
ncbi:MAG: glycosyltransferase family 39 protein [Gemmatimonadaceae bacterium]|nr:glycosyltransferase family 39 protein [Gemmatimonadaceae bacterium]